MTTNAIEHMLDKAHEQKPMKEVIGLSTEALQGLSESKAAALKDALGASTIEDLATNKYVLWAQAMVTLASAEKDKKDLK